MGLTFQGGGWNGTIVWDMINGASWKANVVASNFMHAYSKCQKFLNLKY